MSGGIEEPYTIAHLPRPLDAEHGRILAAPVHSLSGLKKRKRHEIAVAVDGESINIYNTQNQTLSSSYPLPPQSYLAVPPFSIYCKRQTKSLPSQRQTYFATRDTPHDQKLRLFSITEDLGKPLGEECEPRVPAKKERKLRAGNIIGLDVVQGQDSIGSSVLVSHDNGNVDCLSSDLSGTRWEHTPTSEAVQVEYAAVVDFAAARKGLLKGREDVLAMLDPSPSTTPNTHAPHLLVQILRFDTHRQVRILALRNVRGDTLQSRRSPLEELVAYSLPVKNNSKNVKYELHPGTGMLYQRLGAQLNIFDMSGTVPRLVAELGRKGTPRVDSFARLSSATVFTINSQTLAVCETKFGSVLSSLEYQSPGSVETTSTLCVVSQFIELGVVVALSGNNLVAFQVGDILDDTKRAKAHAPLLIDVLGKGSRLDERDGAELTKKQLRKRQKWDNWKSNIDGLISDGDMQGLENLVAQDIRLNDGNTHSGEDALADGLTNGLSDLAEDSIWELPPHTYDAPHTDHRKALYILGSLFAWREPAALPRQSVPKLQLKFLSKNVLRWLTMAGYMTRAHIERALRNSATGFETRPRASPGDVMAALKDADPSFTLMRDLLSLPIHWDLAEVVHGLHILVRSFEAESHKPAHAILTDASNGDVSMTNGDDDEARLQAEVDAATKQLDEVQNLLETGLQNRSRTCQILFYRLHTFPQADVARAMRAILSQDELIFFIAILRLELGHAGWTRTYVEADQATEDELPITNMDNPPELEPSNQAIRTIADLCSCAIDAIGLSGWLVGLSGDVTETARLVAETRNEVTAAAEGLVRVDCIHTMLAEIIKTAGSVQQMGHQRKRKRPHEEELISEDTMLPLGGRLAAPQLKTWRNQDNVKSKQATAEEKSRSVGKYSFERIRL